MLKKSKERRKGHRRGRVRVRHSVVTDTDRDRRVVTRQAHSHWLTKLTSLFSGRCMCAQRIKIESTVCKFGAFMSNCTHFRVSAPSLLIILLRPCSFTGLRETTATYRVERIRISGGDLRDRNDASHQVISTLAAAVEKSHRPLSKLNK